MKLKALPFLTVGAGLLGAVLRWILYATGLDRKGLLVSGHWAATALWCLSLAFALVLLISVRKSDAGEMPSLRSHAIGSFLCAVGMILSGISGISSAGSGLDAAATVMSLAAGAALLYTGICLWRNAVPHYLAFCAVSVCFALRMVSRYRLWSSDPQLMDYCFYMLAHVCLMLTAYHLAASAAGSGQPRKRAFFALAAGYLCLLSLQGDQDPLFMGLCGIWAMACGAMPAPQPREEA